MERQPPSPSYILDAERFPDLFQVVSRQEYTLIGPTIQNQTICYGKLETVNELPIGWTDHQQGGKYELSRRDDDAYFGYQVGPQSWKEWLFPPRQRLWKSRRDKEHQLKFEAAPLPEQRYAFLGVRSCELHAIAMQDHIFQEEEFCNPYYARRRQNTLILAVNCTQAGNNCFCGTMGTSPPITQNYDWVMTEILAPTHCFLVEAGSEAGEAIVQELQLPEASVTQNQTAHEAVASVKDQAIRPFETKDLRNLLYDNLEHSQWDEVAQRCLSCANCTLVCPTCFCSTVEDVSDISNTSTQRWQRWDSCFSLDFSYIHGGTVRTSVKSRYRQWLTHKFAGWQDQFGSLGCVGCGRCITWCPVGIDITEILAALQDSPTN